MLRTQNLATDMGYAFVGNALHKAFGFLIIAVLARYIAKPEMGQFFLASGIATIVAMFTELGTSRHLVRTVAREPADAARSLGLVLGLRIPLVALALAGTAVACAALGVASFGVFLSVTAYILVGDLYYAYGAVLIARRAIVRRAATLLTGPVILLAAVGVGSRFGWSFDLILLLHAASSVAMLIVAAAVTHRLIGSGPTRPERGQLPALVMSSLPFFLVSLLALASSRVPEIMLAALSGYEEVASFAAAFKLLEVSRFVIRPLAMVLFPVFAAASVSASLAAHRGSVRRLVAGSAAVGVALALLVIPTAGLIVSWVYGPDYADSAGVTRVLFMATPALFVGQAALLVALAFDLERPTIAILVGGVLGAIVLNAVLIPLRGPTGAAFATLASELTIAAALLIMISVFARRQTAASPGVASPSAEARSDP